jgi:hypothetical protein
MFGVSSGSSLRRLIDRLGKGASGDARTFRRWPVVDRLPDLPAVAEWVVDSTEPPTVFVARSNQV